MNSSLTALVDRHRKGGLIVDTNILLLYCVGRYRADLIQRFKRTQQFEYRDYELLTNLLKRFHRVLTTPTILSEVSNLIGVAKDPFRSGMLRSVADAAKVLDERYKPSRLLVTEQDFFRLGLTDASIVDLAENKSLVLTDDYRLSQSLAKRGLAAINFYHLYS